MEKQKVSNISEAREKLEKEKEKKRKEDFRKRVKKEAENLNW